MLARHYHAHIVAVGRTPMPQAYPYQGISDDASLKRMLFDEVNRADDLNEADAAAQVKSEHARIRRQREIWTNRERVLQAGGRFSYHQVDITDATALAKTLATIREGKYGQRPQEKPVPARFSVEMILSPADCLANAPANGVYH